MNPEAVTKVVKRYGNSGGVYLPSSWIGGMVEVTITRQPAEPEKDIPLAFAGSMKHIISIILYGSHARGEAQSGSDIDIIVVTDDHMKGIKAHESLKGMDYDIRIMSADAIRKAAERDPLLIKSLEDAKAIFNGSFLNELKAIKPKRGLDERIAMARSSLNIMKSLFEEGGDNSSLVYPLVMRIREMLLIECLREGRRYSLRLLEERLTSKDISRSDYHKLMDDYRAVRDGRKPGKARLAEHTMEKLLDILEEMVDNAEAK